jgi:hypothetical protein
MKAAGWVTLSSSDGTTKDTTATYDGDKWNGTIGTGGTGAAASITTVVGGVATLTGLTGFATGTAEQRWITITGAASGGNNGTFKILSFLSSSSITIRNSAAVASDANNGSISWTERIPLSDTYTIGTNSWINMQGPSVLKIPIATLAQDGYQVNVLGNNQTGTAASISAINNGLVTVTGLSNMIIGSSSNVLVITGAATAANNGSFTIIKQLSPNSVLIANPAGVAPDANNGSIHWQERMVISGARGENVTQTTTGAQGEVVGINFDFLSGTGYLVVFPRNNGSGGGPFGWDGTNTITGATSTAVWTPTATPTEFVREVVIWVGAAGRGVTTYMQCINNSTENASRFSVLAGSAGATATVAPGGGGTGNTFPIPGSYVAMGAGGSKSDANFGMITTTGTMTNAQIMCASATFDLGRSADGSFTCAIGTPTGNTTTAGSTTIAAGSNGQSLPQSTINIASSTNFPTASTVFVTTSAGIQTVTHTGKGTGTLTGCSGGTGTMTTGGAVVSAGGYVGFCFTRVDDQEDGEVDPYIFYNPSVDILYSAAGTNRVSLTGAASEYNGGNATGRGFNAGTGTEAGTGDANSTSSCNLSTFRGWRGRGSINDSFQAYQIGLLVNGPAYSSTSGTGSACMLQNTTDVEVNTTATVSTIVNTNSVFTGEPIWVVSAQTQVRCIKGSCRWLRCVMLGAVTDTLGANSGVGFWLQLCTGTSAIIPFVAGPWDGSTVPVK